MFSRPTGVPTYHRFTHRVDLIDESLSPPKPKQYKMSVEELT